jgi:hypothetical protein
MGFIVMRRRIRCKLIGYATGLRRYRDQLTDDLRLPLANRRVQQGRV